MLTRTLSKSYGLAGLRIGYAAARPDVIAALAKVKDSYNCDALALAGGAAALRDADWLDETVRTVTAERERLAAGLRGLGFRVEPSGGNFLFVTHPDGDHRGSVRVSEGAPHPRAVLRLRELARRHAGRAADHGGNAGGDGRAAGGAGRTVGPAVPAGRRTR